MAGTVLHLHEEERLDVLSALRFKLRKLVVNIAACKSWEAGEQKNLETRDSIREDFEEEARRLEKLIKRLMAQ